MKKKPHHEWSKDKLVHYVDLLLKRKKFGIVWEPKDEDVAEKCKQMLPVISYDEKKSILNNNGETNILIQGDNYESLSVLNYTHKKKIDIIYIDPPYNTGDKDFMYNDKFIDTEDHYRHSKWLSFMQKRLLLSKRLLKDTGFMFVSIDENEFAQLKILMDEIFGRENFINCITVKTKTSSGASGGGEDKKLKKNIEFLLFYAKNRNFFKYQPVYIKRNLFDIIDEKEEDGKSFEYKSVLKDLGSKKLYKVIKDGSGKDIKIYKHAKYKVLTLKAFAKENNCTEKEVYLNHLDKIFRLQPAQSSIRTRVNTATENSKDLYSIEYTPRSGKNKGTIATNYYLKCDLVNWLSDTTQKIGDKLIKQEKAGTLWDDLTWQGLSSEGGVKFRSKKPIAFLERMFSLYPYENATILDFFAGSGSTGHAVLNLNEKDGQKRKFILCTNDKDENGSHKIMTTVLYPRIINVINGYGKKKGLGGNLRFFKTEFIDKIKTDKDKRDFVRKAAEMLCLSEETFDKIISNKDFALYESIDKATMIIFDENEIEEAKKVLKKNKKMISIYIFSYDHTVDESDFEDIPKVKIKPIPEVILNVYRKIFKELYKPKEI